VRSPRSDYYIVTVSDESRFNWRWEIKRRSEPMGVRLTGNSYSSQRPAEEAGRRGLSAFLAEIEVKRGDC
jgi:hypothetical protein